MYVPPDGKLAKGQPFFQFLHSTILPITASDPNIIFKPSNTLKFAFLDSTFEPDLAIRVGRTPLYPDDPSTYVDVSKYMEYSLRRFHSSTAGSTNTNQLDKPAVPIPLNLTGVQPNGKGEVLPFGCQVNPLASDSFKQVHLTPGCLYSDIDFNKTTAGQGSYLNSMINTASSSSPSSSTTTSTVFKNNIFSSKKSKSLSMVNSITTNLSNLSSNSTSGNDLKQPNCSLLKNTSSIISKVITGDNYVKKIANSNRFIVSTHGRIINLFALSDNRNQINVDPPLVKITLNKNIITSLDIFGYINSNNEKVIDILIGLSNGEILWISPFKMRFSRFNNGGYLNKSPVLSCKWMKNGKFFVVGFGNGESIVIGRSFENPETYKPNMIKKKLKFGIIRNSLIDSNDEFGHYKLSNKSITDIKFHPTFDNLMAITCDDGYIRLCDLLTERVIELHSSYYGGLISCQFTNDGKYLLIGGCDDNVTIYKFQVGGHNNSNTDNNGITLKIIGRLVGSKAWIKSINEINFIKSLDSYTISAVGDDGYFRIWQFPKEENLDVIPQDKTIPIDPILLSKHAIFKTNEYNILSINGFGLIGPQIGYQDVENIPPIFQFDINLGKVVFCSLNSKYLWIGIATGDLMRWVVT